MDLKIKIGGTRDMSGSRFPLDEISYRTANCSWGIHEAVRKYGESSVSG